MVTNSIKTLINGQHPKNLKKNFFFFLVGPVSKWTNKETQNLFVRWDSLNSPAPHLLLSAAVSPGVGALGYWAASRWGIFIGRTVLGTNIMDSILTSLVAQAVKAASYNAGDPYSIPESGRFPGEGNGHPLQYSCLENPMDGQRSLVGYSPWGSQKVRHDWATSLSFSISWTLEKTSQC